MLTSLKLSDGVWHAARDQDPVTLCGLLREPPRRGRRSKVNCPECLAAGGHAVLASPEKRGPKLPPVVVVRPTTSTKSDPAIPAAIPADGRCAQCAKPRRPERSKRYARDAAHGDPFCSMECCRRWHGLAVPGDADERELRAGEELAA